MFGYYHLKRLLTGKLKKENKPTTNGNIDFSDIITMVIEYVETNKYKNEAEFRYILYLNVMEKIYGKNIWKYIHNKYY